MAIPAVYLSDKSQLKVGMKLYSVGFGGWMPLQKPKMFGTITALDKIIRDGNFIDSDRFFITNRKTYHSYLDWHVVPQNYNSWYLCDTMEKAQEIYDYMASEKTNF